MFSEFKDFIARGNVLDLAVGVIIGAAFGTVVKSLTDDIIMPIVGALFGGVDFTNYFFALGEVPIDTPATLEAMRAANVPVLAFGAFATTIINFLILAFIIFLLVRFANRMLRTKIAEGGPSEVDLLTEIRDEMRKR
jgi:large conductance mechanosensitive channel